MCDRRHSALLTVIVPMVIGEIVRAYGIDEKTATERFYAMRRVSCGITRPRLSFLFTTKK